MTATKANGRGTLRPGGRNPERAACQHGEAGGDRGERRNAVIAVQRLGGALLEDGAQASILRKRRVTGQRRQLAAFLPGLDQLIEARKQTNLHEIGPARLRPCLGHRRDTGSPQPESAPAIAAALLRNPSCRVGEQFSHVLGQGPALLQKRDPVFDRAQQRQKSDQPFVECANHRLARPLGRRVVRQARAQDREFGYVTRDPALLLIDRWGELAS